MTNEDGGQSPEVPELDGEVGRELRKARETKGLSVAEVAEHQHLRPSIIDAIEEGRYAQIGSELFLKGYVRAYAEQLGLDASDLIARLDHELEPIRVKAVEAQRTNPLENIAQKKRRKRRIARWVLLILVLAAAAFLASRFVPLGALLGSDSASDKGSVAESTQAAPADESATDTAEVSVETDTAEFESDGVLSPAADEPEAPFGPADSGSDTAGEPDSEPLTEDVADNTSSDQTIESPVGSATESSLAPVGEPESAPADEVSPAVTGAAVLTASFSADCWVSVKNGEGLTVVSVLKREGDTLRYEGPAPFGIVLGAADAASLNFNGEAVDLSRYPASNNRVSLTLGN
ncbi:RodZ domain-containing protein [Marinobacter sp. 1Y8]